MNIIRLPSEISLRVEQNRPTPSVSFLKPSALGLSRAQWEILSSGSAVTREWPGSVVRERRTALAPVRLHAVADPDIGFLIGAPSVGTSWVLEHDFERFYAEVSAAERFLRQLTPLIGLLDEAAAHKTSNDWIEYADNEPSVRSQVIAHLLRGGSLKELGIDVSSLGRARLVFDASNIAFENPFFSKLHPYLKFEYDSKISLGTVISAISVIIALAALKLNSDDPRSNRPVNIEIRATQKSPRPLSAGMIQVGNSFYHSTLQSADFSDIQRGLFLAGFDAGPIDGKKGDQTKKAADKFCKKADIPFKGYEDPAFLKALSLRLANKLPVFADQP